jgi:hypothetical protein
MDETRAEEVLRGGISVTHPRRFLQRSMSRYFARTRVAFRGVGGTGIRWGAGSIPLKPTRPSMLLGVKRLGSKGAMPPVNDGPLDGALAWRQDDGGHTDAPDMRYFIEWADRRMKPWRGDCRSRDPSQLREGLGTQFVAGSKRLSFGRMV